MYAELHCKTNFSFLEGASHPGELVEQAAALGYAALAITDRNSLAGVVRAHGMAKDVGLKILIGAEMTPRDAPPVVLWAIDRRGYGRLARLITLGRRQAPKGECRFTLDQLAQHAEGLLAGVLPRPPQIASERQSDEAALVQFLEHHLSQLHQYREMFGDRLSLLAELHLGPDDRRRLQALRELAQTHRVPLAAAGDVHYHVARRMPLHNVLTAVRHGITVHEAGERFFPNAIRHLQSPAQLAATFAAAPEAVERTRAIAERCVFSLDELRYEYPEELAPPGKTPMEHLRALAWKGAQQRYPGAIPDKVRRLVEHELALIESLRYEAYFLTVWDLVRFARSRGILCQGRGSAANSAVCYCLGVTSVDPEQLDLLFERFISRERNEAPDIDIDFEHERREEVLQYLYDKYGRERTGMTAEVICYRPRSAARDVGKALGLSLDRVDALAKSLEGHRSEPELAERCQMSGIDPESRIGRQLITLVQDLLGFPRHLGQHVGGMVMTQGPLCELVPIENAAMPERTVIQWDKDDLDELGILKVDCLALGMLTAIRKCFQLVHEHTGRKLTLANIPPDDEAVYDMICRADTLGVFQIESRAQMSMLPRLRPRCFYDLVIEVAIVRPGPIQGNMVHPYLRRRNGEEQATYPNQAIRQVLEKTLGVPLFQEQAMRLAVVAAGFTPGEADQLRRAMGAWRRQGLIDQFHQRLIAGMLQRGLPYEFAEHVFSQIRGFGEYGFPESHAASFASLAYASSWLKYHYPAAFTAALLNSQPMGFYAPAQLVRDAREHQVEVRPADVNHSDWNCTLEKVAPAPCEKAAKRPRSALRLGLRQLVGFSQRHAQRIVAARRAGRFRSLEDFTRRTGLSPKVIEQLAAADAFQSLRVDRRHALWHALGQEKHSAHLPLLSPLPEDDEPLPHLPPLSEQQQVYADYQTAGLSLRAHPLSFHRAALRALHIEPNEALQSWPNDTRIRVAGLVLVRQRPGTARGITFATIEDETGVANLVIRHAIYHRFYRAARQAAALIATGRVERKHDVIHIVVETLEDLAEELKDLRTKSRDFR